MLNKIFMLYPTLFNIDLISVRWVQHKHGMRSVVVVNTLVFEINSTDDYAMQHIGFLFLREHDDCISISRNIWRLEWQTYLVYTYSSTV